MRFLPYIVFLILLYVVIISIKSQSEIVCFNIKGEAISDSRQCE